MSGTRESQTVRVISPAAQLVRLSFLCSQTQVDVSVPLDVPIAGLTPDLVKLARVREAAEASAVDEPLKDANRNVWVLSRRGETTPLPPDVTLREAGVAEGELLRIRAQPALSPPTLYDDVVDAAARLNKAGYAGWDGVAARWMTFAGVYGAAAVWVYFLLAPTFMANHAALVGLSAVAALGLAGVAAIAHRSHGRSDIGAALGWAAIPVAAAIAWTGLHTWGGYAQAAGCVAVAAFSAALFRGVGTGHWGYLTAAVVCIFAGLALVAHTTGIKADLTGVVLALVATLGCRAAPAFTLLFTSRRPRGSGKHADLLKKSSAEDLWARVRSDDLTRAAFRAGLAVSAALGALVVLASQHPTKWSGLVFAIGCAAALGLYAREPVTAVERAALGVPAVALALVACVLAQRGGPPLRLTAFGLLLAATVAFAAAGTARLCGRLATAAAYSAYLMTAALIPLALWVLEAYPRWYGT
ncbi:type VII secretion integral membrane protein EccD [Mycobacterium sp. Aquia_216]|uniref:type VII secretion integral membrane protein EccD n=1 Tax=Mycobacterium sp. Aquia_216 TaxID=2991729 RepID=UPI00227A1871|nr:type VII secretion integral membrane protein EccD [Mycobacterium sp. Aquia_216]WAJ46375.1 type VII secretion integral membrane protein EccD [Mycobacterium sp. Aquia_216]